MACKLVSLSDETLDSIHPDSTSISVALFRLSSSIGCLDAGIQRSYENVDASEACFVHPLLPLQILLSVIGSQKLAGNSFRNGTHVFCRYFCSQKRSTLAHFFISFEKRVVVITLFLTTAAKMGKTPSSNRTDAQRARHSANVRRYRKVEKEKLQKEMDRPFGTETYCRAQASSQEQSRRCCCRTASSCF